MNVTPDEASRSLAAVRQAQTRTRKTTAAWAYFLLIWGVYWALPPVLHQAIPSIPQVWLWWGCMVPCYIASAIIGQRIGTQMRARVPSAFAWLFVAPVGFGGMWLWLAWPLMPLEIGTIVLCMVMGSYMIAGIVLHQQQLLALGAIIGGCAVLAYGLGTYVAPANGWLWQALLQGGGLIGCGIYALRRGA